MENTAVFDRQLKDITDFFTDDKGNTQRLLYATDVAKYLGIHRTRVAKLYNINRKGRISITIFELAKLLTDAEPTKTTP